MNFPCSSARRPVLMGVVLLMPIVILIILGPLFLPNPLEVNVENALQKPSLEHPLGTDVLGRDNLSRLCYGGRHSFFISLAALAGSLLCGVGMGFLSGWLEGWGREIIDRILEVVMCIPGIILALILVTFLGKGETSIVVALTVGGTVYMARMVRGLVRLNKGAGYILAAQVSGLPKWRIIGFHLLPNISGPIFGYAVVLAGVNIMAESGFSFLGLSVQPPEPSWGFMLYQSRNYLTTAPWLALAPGTAIFITVLGFNLLGDGLRGWFDPTRKCGAGVGGRTIGQCTFGRQGVKY
ncbi:ABC transporter permease [Thermincola potens]|uniref:Binding-protein-dependent transport systems inner membrane component n=1 Tax=Thermincola potens (strain JR) TaxID=635013 RepID=D5XDW5_THEPJ|nr:ABC transporter permease [Thermincola potens]ADG81836.1 binding-protein-dependent transport systems inner membrane component [Thermincola potens JR]